MNTSTSGCSSGCESGWTMYLDQLSNSTDPYRRAFVQNYKEKGERVNRQDEEAEDLSMVSDASSGPPHLHEHYTGENQYYGGYACSVPENKTAKSKTKEPRIKKQHNLCLDDTASSSVFHFSQDNVAPPENHNSVKHVPTFSQGESVPRKQFGFFTSSKKGKSSGGLLGRKRQ
ncbi:uncharacterized protein LOC105155598 isoform X2 [Sesamum indicum]|uniref:Uncharacterized protein LOC105155598 isoform X2 n=1 Tax=Sesamum indicum TaxID=4182 RepID=A0A6I9SJP7_SESIN|nr:uncharacterized protein LOC105155598 isoform X2 [Sesamum indicum]